ncbi:hypothetical protein I601_1917 [Nocardioides dokdonensis FR1436]|uniref:Uncharacterized protein n=1 Tax=Nocardioides dokdonensis FR1436 TaxID=1300347 RepID=A0A1A9GJ50_9ACTN|nr:hypothetical protein [Nocardioides dokdonensis]ANH38347.1 hypothetical protein I601_1917 [Nocardioides dokdonensis FR1436]
MDMGESIAGAYLRHVEKCQSITFNTFLPDAQGEIDVIGVRLGEQIDVFVAEVAIHLEGLQYGTYDFTTKKVRTKMASARRYAERLYPTANLHLEFWSPIVPSGLVERIEQHAASEEFTLVANKEFTGRVQSLVDLASKHTKTTGEPAYRMLQLLTHLRGHANLQL